VPTFQPYFLVSDIQRYDVNMWPAMCISVGYTTSDCFVVGGMLIR